MVKWLTLMLVISGRERITMKQNTEAVVHKEMCTETFVEAPMFH